MLEQIVEDIALKEAILEEAALEAAALERGKVRMEVISKLKRDVQAIMERDPAVQSVAEAVLCYPGFHAVILHRIAHRLYKHRLVLLPRLLSQWNRFVTGIEIHPGAAIGEGLFIDHGMGVVIGENAEIGDDVTIYQEVTLDGDGSEKGQRRPAIGDNVVISTGAKMLDSVTVGGNVRIEPNTVVFEDIPGDSAVVGVPGRIVARDDGKPGVDGSPYATGLEPGQLDDPVDEMLNCLQRKIARLEKRLEELECVRIGAQNLQYVDQKKGTVCTEATPSCKDVCLRADDL